MGKGSAAVGRNLQCVYSLSLNFALTASTEPIRAAALVS